MAINQKLKLFAKSDEDLQVISTLCQDAVGIKSNMKWSKKAKAFSVVINRLIWEDLQEYAENKIYPKRVQAILFFRWIISVKSRGFKLDDEHEIFSLLSLQYYHSNGTDNVKLIFSGNAEVYLEVEYLEVFLKDVGSAYQSKAPKLPLHKT